MDAMATERLETLLREAFPNAAELAVEDRTGGGDHFQVVVADVYDALSEPLADGTIHELRIKTKGTA